MVRQRQTGRRHSLAAVVAATIAGVAVSAALTPSVDAQIIHGQKSTVRQGLVFQSWKLDEGAGGKLELTQLLVPLQAGVALSDNWELAILTAIQQSSGKSDILDTDISGLSDSRIQLTRSLADDRFLAALAVRIPTGQREFDTDQLLLARQIAEDYLNLPLKNLGEGFSVSLLGGAATPAGDWILGAALGMESFGSYDPTADGDPYTPGSRVTLTLGADRPFENGLVRADVVIVKSGEDQSDGTGVFQDGGQVSFRLTGTKNLGGSRIEGSARFIARGKDKRSSAGELASDPEKFNGNEIRVGGRAVITASPKVNVSGGFTAKFVGANDFTADSPQYDPGSHLLGIGGGIEALVSPNAKLGVGVRVYTGSIKEIPNLDARNISGFEISETLTLFF